MINWASSDVDKLLALASKQTDILDARGESHIEKAKAHSVKHATVMSSMKVNPELRCKIPIGRFLGTRGCNLRSLERSTGAFVYQYTTATGPTQWMVFYPTDAALAGVK